MSDPLAGTIGLPDATPVRGRALRRPIPAGPLPDFGLYLASRPGGRRHSSSSWQPSWPADWVDWPDFRTPREPGQAVASIVNAYELARSGRRVEVACAGGTGRTGTVIACLSILAGHPADDAVAWTRQHYRRRAVETPGQRRWIRWFAAHVGR